MKIQNEITAEDVPGLPGVSGAVQALYGPVLAVGNWMFPYGNVPARGNRPRAGGRAERGPLTILMPCKDQKKEFLVEALKSVIEQSSPFWKLKVIVHSDSPAKITEIINGLNDHRIQILINQGGGLGGALNIGMRGSNTEYLCILLSDDKLDPKAIEIIQKYIQRFPETDFFYSSRKYIDAQGQIKTPLMKRKRKFNIDDFAKKGSPVKHLLCWRRVKGLEIGGMDETLSDHGCDDYDFPWRMAEAGCRFKAIKECLYYYRIHHDFHRLTTHVSLARQVECLKAMFRKHKVSEPEITAYLENALNGYLITDKTLNFENQKSYLVDISNYREMKEDRKEEFLSKGYASRYFFPHQIYYLPKGGPDGLKLASRLCKISNPQKLWEICLYAMPPMIDEFPLELFFDKELIWHEQHFGKPGHVATANLVIDRGRLFGYVYQSDLVQRISSYRREAKTRIENRLKGWNRMLLNAIMAFALEKKIKMFYSPTADLAREHTDRNRKVKKELFDRIYDRTLCQYFDVDKSGPWWRVNVSKNKNQIIVPQKRIDIVERSKTICICHDIERGYGHFGVDTPFAASIHTSSIEALEKMLSIEKKLDLKATYHVLGLLFEEVRGKIEKDGHACAFHSYDHKVPLESKPPRTAKKISNFITGILKGVKPDANGSDQLSKCRAIDYRVKGYRPAQSKITPEFTEENLGFHNFEWFASSAGSLNSKVPKSENGIVKIPILFDDFALYKNHMSYQAWEEEAINKIQGNDFVALSLHDCYADYWLPHYESFLKKIIPLGNFKTLDEVSAEVILCSGQ